MRRGRPCQGNHIPTSLHSLWGDWGALGKILAIGVICLCYGGIWQEVISKGKKNIWKPNENTKFPNSLSFPPLLEDKRFLSTPSWWPPDAVASGQGIHPSNRYQASETQGTTCPMGNRSIMEWLNKHSQLLSSQIPISQKLRSSHIIPVDVKNNGWSIYSCHMGRGIGALVTNRQAVAHH